MDGSLFGLRQDCNGQSGIVKPALPFPRLPQQSGDLIPQKNRIDKWWTREKIWDGKSDCRERLEVRRHIDSDI
jgi:hypothetical protein